MAIEKARDASRPMFIFGRLVDFMTFMLQASLVIAAAVMLVCITYQVVLRYLFSSTPSWTEELAILMFAWATLGGLALGVREGFHVRMTLLLDPLKPGPRRLADIAINGLTAVFGMYLLLSGWRFVDVTSGSTSAAIGYPIELLHSMAPVSGALIALFALERILVGGDVKDVSEELVP